MWKLSNKSLGTHMHTPREILSEYIFYSRAEKNPAFFIFFCSYILMESPKKNCRFSFFLYPTMFQEHEGEKEKNDEKFLHNGWMICICILSGFMCVCVWTVVNVNSFMMQYTQPTKTIFIFHFQVFNKWKNHFFRCRLEF